MNQDHTQKFHRKSIRLKNYDYSQPGAYFVTIVTKSRNCLFGSVENGEMILNNAGKMIEQVCHEVEKASNWISLGPFTVMPNHLHIIINLGGFGYFEESFSEEKKISIHYGLDEPINHLSLVDVIGWIKSISTCRYIHGVKNKQWPKFDSRLWQRSYYDHVIRDELDYEAISEYILSNPMNWDKDEEYCEA